MKQRQIVFFGNFGTQNLGNECTLHAIICSALKRVPDARLKCLCTVPEDTAARHNISAFGFMAASPAWLSACARAWRSRRARARSQTVPMQSGLSGPPRGSAVQPPKQALNGQDQPGEYGPLAKWLRRLFFRIPIELLHWAKGFRLMRGSHMLIVPGTGIVSDYLTGPFGWAYDIFKWTTIAKLCRVKVLFVSIGVGPIYHPLSKWFIRTSLRFAEYRSYRDTASKQYMEGIGFHTNGDRVCPDLAFGLPRGMFSERPLGRGEKPIIGVGLKDYYGPRGLGDRPDAKAYLDYVNTMAAFVVWLCEHRYPVRVLIGDILYDSSVKLDFMNLLKERGLAPGDGQIIAEPVLTVDELLCQLAATDIVISARFHNLVLALMLNKPVLALSDHQKLDSLMAGLGLAGYCVPLRNLGVDILIKHLVELEKNAEKLKPYIKRKVEQYREALDQEYSVIFPAQQA
jgi:polysaccharide pyruvyl transferase WcaK-like protein